MRSSPFYRSLPVLVASFVALSSLSAFAQAKKWVGTWTTGVQVVEKANMPPSPYLSNNTLREIVQVSIGGDSVRVKLSNDFSRLATTINSATIAVSKGKSTIDTATLKQLKFNGSASVTIADSSAVISDPVAFNLTPRMNVAISIYYGQTSDTLTGHPGSRTTSYLVSGKQDTAAAFSVIDTFSHWYTINTIDAWTSSSAASVAILGNSIADGRGSVTDSQNRWPDLLSQRLLNNPATAQVGVLNLGIGGGCVFSLNSACLGPSALNRYMRDIISQRGVKWLIICEGVNDIGITAKAASTATTTADSLILAYTQIITAAHTQGMKVYGATIMPLGNNYYNQYSESCRATVNLWIRTSGLFDSVIDFDKTVRSTTDTTKLGIASFQSDGLHPTEAGYQTMANSINLNLFTQSSGVKDAANRNITAPGMFRVNHVNAGTRVTFELSHEAFVSLKVYSILGREIAGLAGKKFSSGMHTVEFNNGNLAKGMYLYSLKIDNHSAGQMMVY